MQVLQMIVIPKLSFLNDPQAARHLTMVMTMIIPLAMPKPKAANDDVDDVDIDESPVDL
eukprot:CAMPEP_0196230696 /NCGR_PEP_ID=MMETSP0913-20130531/1807_1 /TAXON_ID=49265 /ORGANISM="Thalassiosira rotula, Strain GSO102" /LENGTH=58 /DNA_ID=CAMNT_0041510775 /DNA_START=46 /DNA_END=222 /DNA_ORIENTATION=-